MGTSEAALDAVNDEDVRAGSARPPQRRSSSGTFTWLQKRRVSQEEAYRSPSPLRTERV